MNFCGKCRNRKFIDLGGCTANHCKVPSELKFNAIGPYQNPVDCMEKNKNNDCKDYTRKVIFRDLCIPGARKG